MRTSTIATSGRVRAHLQQQVVRVARAADDLEALVLEQLREPLAEQHRVLGDHDRARDLPHDARAAARRALDAEAPAARLDAVGEAAQPGAAVEARAARRRRRRPRSISVPFSHARRDRGARGVRVLGDVRERLARDEVGVGLDARARSAPRSAATVTGSGERGGERVERGGEAALGQDRRVDAVRELAQLLRRPPGGRRPWW